MQQLSGLDAAFVHQDSQRTPMHICAVLIYDCIQKTIDRTTIRELVERRLATFPLFRRKLKPVVMGLDTPYWVDLEEPDWDRHITEFILPPASDWDTLFQHLSNVHGARMDLKRPLWEIHLVHGMHGLPGLPSRCQALVLKIHHSAIDGMSMAAIIDALHRIEDERPHRADRLSSAPGQLELWTRAHVNSVSRQFRFAETMGNLLPGFIRARQTRRQFADLPTIYNAASHFNNRVTGGRNCGAVILPMPEVLAIKRAVRRVTLNDIAMSCVAGALREYLCAYRKLPARTLAAGVPINLRSPDDLPSGGNKIATMVVGLATHIAAPVERLRLVHRYAVAGKRQIDALGSGTIMDISDSLPPGMLAEGLRTMSWARRVAEIPVPFHTMISNVPGPTAPMFLRGARLAVPMGLGPVRDNMGLFHIVGNSDSNMTITFSACRRLLPDAAFYRQCLRSAFTELLAESQTIGKAGKY